MSQGIALPRPQDLCSVFVCPSCRSPLITDSHNLDRINCSDSNCRSAFFVTAGIPRFLSPEGPSTDPELVDVETTFTDHRKPRGPLSELVGSTLYALIKASLADASSELGRRLTILDLGCGEKPSQRTGWKYFDLLGDVCQSYYGIDPSLAALKSSAQPDSDVHKFPTAALAMAAGERLPLPDSSVDVILAISVLDHCVDARRALHECRRVLRPGGKLLVHLGNRQGWPFRLMRRVMPRMMGQRDASDHHTNVLPSRSIELLESLGYQDIVLHERAYISLPPQGKRIETIIWRMGTYMVLGQDRFASVARRADALAARHLPDKGSEYTVIAAA